jgi:hypothetical protein
LKQNKLIEIHLKKNLEKEKIGIKTSNLKDDDYAYNDDARKGSNRSPLVSKNKCSIYFELFFYSPFFMLEFISPLVM